MRAQPLVVSTFAHVTVTLQLSVAPMPGSQSGMFVGLQPRSVLPFRQVSNVGEIVSTFHENARVHVEVLPHASVAV